MLQFLINVVVIFLQSQRQTVYLEMCLLLACLLVYRLYCGCHGWKAHLWLQQHHLMQCNRCSKNAGRASKRCWSAFWCNCVRREAACLKSDEQNPVIKALQKCKGICLQRAQGAARCRAFAASVSGSGISTEERGDPSSDCVWPGLQVLPFDFIAFVMHCAVTDSVFVVGSSSSLNTTLPSTSAWSSIRASNYNVSLSSTAQSTSGDVCLPCSELVFLHVLRGILNVN